MTNISDFDTKITLLSVTRTKGTAGGNKETVNEVGTFYASVDENQDVQKTAIAVMATDVLRIKTHRRTDVSLSHVLLINGRTFDVRGIKPDERIYMLLDAERSDRNIHQYINLNEQLVDLNGDPVVL